MDCSSQDRNIICDNLDTSITSAKSAFRKWSSKNHPDKASSQEDKKIKTDMFQKLNNAKDNCISDSTQMMELCSHVTSQKTKKAKKSERNTEKDTKNKKELVDIKKAECIRKTANWTGIKRYHRFDSETFDPSKLREDIIRTSPKMQFLLKNIAKLDARDKQKHGKLFKHFIYSDIKSQGYGAKIIASAFLAYGFEICIVEKKGSIVIEIPKSTEKLTFGLLSSTAVYGTPTKPNIRKNLLRIFNERPDNVHGEKIRFIILDSGFKEGIDLFDVKYVHIFEPQRTPADYAQALGRSTRLCGQKGLKFVPNKGWKLEVYNYENILPSGKPIHDLYLKYSDLDLGLLKVRENIEKLAIESAVDRELTGNIHRFVGQKQQTGGAYDTTKVKCQGGKCGSRSTKDVPFTLIQLQTIYETFGKKYPTSKKKFNEQKSKEKRAFFCEQMAKNQAYCDRLIHFVNGEYKLPEKTRKKLVNNMTKKQKDELILNLKNPMDITETALVPLNSSLENVSKKSSQNPLKYSSDLVIREEQEEPEEPEEPEDEEGFADFQRRINKQFSAFKYDKVTVENLCDIPVNSSRVVEFTASQDFISHYFVPERNLKGMLVWHSVGTGKTCTALATKSRTWEKEGYTILWVTRTTLKNDIWKNMFDKVCDYAIREKLEQGEDAPTTKEEMKILRQYMSKKFLPPVSFRQLSNACTEILTKRKNPKQHLGSLSQRLVNLNGEEDPFKKTLIIIDEVHKFFAKDLHWAEKADFDAIQNEMNHSYTVSMKESVRLLMMSATPIMDTSMDFIKLINLITPENKVPVDSKEFLEVFHTNEQMNFTEESKEKLQEYFKGKISFLDRRYDPRLFVQPVFHNAHVKLSLDDENNVKIKCDEELKESLELCNKTLQHDIKKCTKNDPNETKVNKDIKRDEKQITKIEKEMKVAVSNAANGTKMSVKKPFQARMKTLKQKIKSRQDELNRKLKEYNKCLYNADKDLEKCEKKYKKEHKKCIKGSKDLPKTLLDNLTEKCKLLENEF